MAMITLPLSTKRMPAFYNFFWKLLNSPQMKAILCRFTEKFQRRIQYNTLFRGVFSTEAALQRCFWKKMIRKYAANLQENTHAELRFQ